MAGRDFMSVSRPVVTVNAKELLRELTVDSPNSKRMAMAIRSLIAPKIEEKQRELVREFQIHPITVELDAGPRASNTSGTLGGYGNLFSFIGFSSGDRPTDVISRIFNEKIKFKVRRKNAAGKYQVTFFIPSIEEGGLTNLGQYLFSSTGFDSSTSGTGIQAKNRSSGVSFKRMPYVGKLIKDFKNKLLRLDK